MGRQGIWSTTRTQMWQPRLRKTKRTLTWRPEGGSLRKQATMEMQIPD